MISFINPRNTVLAFAFAGFAGIGISSFAGQASAGMLDECHASSKMKVVACCKQHIQRFGRPIWMSNGEDNNCRATAVRCVAKYNSTPFAGVAAIAKKPYCFMDVALEYDESNNHKNIPPASRTPNAAGKN